MMGDLAKPALVREKIHAALTAKAAQLADPGELPAPEVLVAETLELAERVRPHVVDGVAFINDALDRGERVLAEGAQGTLLDVGFGTYPYVTSSATVAAAAALGLGVGPKAIGTVTGITKAYCTRVGGGPFPAELDAAAADRLREAGHEFGVVTGRPRRCGWFDAVAGRYASRLNGLDAMIVTKLDVLSGFDPIGLVTGYRRADGSRAGFEAVGEPGLQVDVEALPGWSEDLRDVRHIKNLPSNAQAYLGRLANEIGVPITLVSVGPERTAFAT
jgi:adenylosuccinate synthase